MTFDKINMWSAINPLSLNLNKTNYVHFTAKTNTKTHININFEDTQINNINNKKLRRMRWVGHVARMGEERGVYRVLVGEPEGERPLGRPRHRWVDNIRMDLQEVGCGYMDWIGLAQDRDRWRTLVSAVMNFLVLWNAGNFLTSCKPVSCSRRTLHHGVSNNKKFLGLTIDNTISWKQQIK